MARRAFDLGVATSGPWRASLDGTEGLLPRPIHGISPVSGEVDLEIGGVLTDFVTELAQ